MRLWRVVAQEWLNTIFYRVWQFHEPLLCEKLRETLALKLEQVREETAALGATVSRWD